MSHLRFHGKEELRWQRRGVTIVGLFLFLIQGWGIVRGLVVWLVRGLERGSITGFTGWGILSVGRIIIGIM